MKYLQGIYYSDSQRAQMWERWQKGEWKQQIAQLFNRNHSSTQRILPESGGIMPRPRCRSERALSLAQRREMSRGVVRHQTPVWLSGGALQGIDQAYRAGFRGHPNEQGAHSLSRLLFRELPVQVLAAFRHHIDASCA